MKVFAKTILIFGHGAECVRDEFQQVQQARRLIDLRFIPKDVMEHQEGFNLVEIEGDNNLYIEQFREFQVCHYDEVVVEIGYVNITINNAAGFKTLVVAGIKCYYTVTIAPKCEFRPSEPN
ncbi:unnamed protein product [Rodentolepis nana]|uniref:DUF3794 domain-containing protein n=1 Tax=Rodentolepis nana TaxID=102285 RepID=A0A0R3TLJ9_RODNA|nr:unnamed protein product [Rodentolepis nana]